MEPHCRMWFKWCRGLLEAAERYVWLYRWHEEEIHISRSVQGRVSMRGLRHVVFTSTTEGIGWYVQTLKYARGLGLERGKSAKKKWQPGTVVDGKDPYLHSIATTWQRGRNVNFLSRKQSPQRGTDRQSHRRCIQCRAEINPPAGRSAPVYRDHNESRPAPTLRGGGRQPPLPPPTLEEVGLSAIVPQLRSRASQKQRGPEVSHLSS